MKSTTHHLCYYASEIKLTQSNVKKNCLLFAFFLFTIGTTLSQKLTYDNFEGNKTVHYGERTGVLDTIAKNPKMDSVNRSRKCALYVRNGAKKFDNIKMELPAKLTGVNAYATYLGMPAKIKMKIYTSAPVGTLVEFLLGSRSGNNDYPAGTNSQYQVYTTVSNAWEELEFKFSQVPQGSETSFSQIDQVTLLFNPNSSTSDTYYFDDITGPVLANEVREEEIVSPNESSKKQEDLQKLESTKKVNTVKKTYKK